jgi:hypothetical protein
MLCTGIPEYRDAIPKRFSGAGQLRIRQEGIMEHRGPDEYRTKDEGGEDQRQDAPAAVVEYQPNGGDDLVPPPEDRPADGELGAGD